MTKTKTVVEPLDYAKLRKGTWIETPRLEELTGAKVGTSKFNLGILHIRAELEKVPIFSCAKNGKLRLMTDGEASPWNTSGANRHARGMYRACERLQFIDESKLSPNELRFHEASSKAITSMATALRTEHRKHERLFGLIPEFVDDDE